MQVLLINIIIAPAAVFTITVEALPSDFSLHSLEELFQHQSTNCQSRQEVRVCGI
jgi:hypothetical protein